MKIAFYPQSCLPCNAHSLDERPLGGVETGIIRLSRALHERGHEVVVYTHDPNPPASEPQYLPLAAVHKMAPVDVFIGIREWFPLVYQIPAKVRLFWTGDSYDQLQSFGIGDRRVAAHIDGLMAVGNWHAQTLAKASGFPLEKIFVVRNGIHSPDFVGSEPRHPKRLIYSSTPFRGLYLFPPIFAELKRRHPDLELQIFSSFSVYHGKDGTYHAQSEQKFQIFQQQFGQVPGVFFRGGIKQRQLAREFMRATVLAYPNTFAETCCITALEAQAAGCPIVTTALAGLPETVGDAGILVPGPAETSEYQQLFIDAVDQVLTSQDLFQRLSKRGLERAKLFGWQTVAEKFEQQLLQRFGEKLNSQG